MYKIITNIFSINESTRFEERKFILRILKKTNIQRIVLALKENFRSDSMIIANQHE